MHCTIGGRRDLHSLYGAFSNTPTLNNRVSMSQAQLFYRKCSSLWGS